MGSLHGPFPPHATGRRRKKGTARGWFAAWCRGATAALLRERERERQRDLIPTWGRPGLKANSLVSSHIAACGAMTQLGGGAACSDKALTLRCGPGYNFGCVSQGQVAPKCDSLCLTGRQHGRQSLTQSRSGACAIKRIAVDCKNWSGPDVQDMPWSPLLFSCWAAVAHNLLFFYIHAPWYFYCRNSG